MRACTLNHFQLFATPWTAACQAALSTEFPRQEYWSVLAFPPPGDLPDPGIKPSLLHCQVSSLLLMPPGEKKSIEHQLDLVWWTDFDLMTAAPLCYSHESIRLYKG